MKQNQTQKVFADTATYAHENLEKCHTGHKMELAQTLEIFEIWRHHSLSLNTNYGNSSRSSLLPAKKRNDYFHSNKGSRICAISGSGVTSILAMSN